MLHNPGCDCFFFFFFRLYWLMVIWSLDLWPLTCNLLNLVFWILQQYLQPESVDSEICTRTKVSTLSTCLFYPRPLPVVQTSILPHSLTVAHWNIRNACMPYIELIERVMLCKAINYATFYRKWYTLFPGHTGYGLEVGISQAIPPKLSVELLIIGCLIFADFPTSSLFLEFHRKRENWRVKKHKDGHVCLLP